MHSTFPIIQSVIEGNSSGKIVRLSGDQILVLHDSGFGQIILNANDFLPETGLFGNDLPKYFHLYNIDSLALNGIFSSNPSSNVLLRKRLKGIHLGVAENPQIPFGYNLKDASELTPEQFEKIPTELYSKFYYSFESFRERSWAKILFTNQNEFCACCYAAAWGGDIAEIDVFTETLHRKKGLAELVVSVFVSNLNDHGKIANWDCFLDNFGSRALAKKCGFSLREEYWMVSIFRINEAI